MRTLGQAFVISCLGVSSLAGAQTPAPDAAAAVVAAAREALGGEKKLTAVKTVVATGRTRQVRGDNLVPIEFEISIELPDKYIRKDEIPAQESGPTASGFNGETLLQFSAPAPPPARSGGPPPPTADQMAAAGRMRLATIRQDFARLMLGMFAGSSSAYTLTFTYVGKAEAPQGKADVLDVKGPPGPGAFAARLLVNADTHLPIGPMPPGIFVMGSPGGNFNVQTMSADALPRFRVGIVVNAQNLTNRSNDVGYSGTLSSPLFGQPTAVQGMRRVDVGLNFNF